MVFELGTFGFLVGPLSKLGVSFAKKRLKAALGSNDVRKKAAWDLYVEMETRITTQFLDPEHGDEKTALKSVRSCQKLMQSFFESFRV